MPQLDTFSAAILQPAIAPECAVEIAVNLKASTTYKAGDVLGLVTATPGTYGLYDDGNSDGTEVAIGLMKYGLATDASGNIIVDARTGVTGKTAPMYIAGVFRAADLIAGSDPGEIDAAAIVDLKARLVGGAVDAAETLIIF